MDRMVEQNPLDVLVISQLTALRRHEAQLQREVERGNGRNIAGELLQLRDRADRLNRMIDAMGIAGTICHPPVGRPLAA
jgi:hypothetical protein